MFERREKSKLNDYPSQGHTEYCLEDPVGDDVLTLLRKEVKMFRSSDPQFTHEAVHKC